MSGLTRLGEAIAREQDALRGRIARRARLRARMRGVHHPARLRPASRWRRVAGGFVVASGCAVAAWLALATRPTSRALVATVGPQAQVAEPGAFLESPPDAPLALDFSDGTRVALEPRARLRMLEIGERGAHLSLEGGRARLDVAPRRDARWQVSAGPFAIRVTGTRFDVRWEPERDRLQVDLEHGRVEVSGCGLREGQPLRAGQRLLAACRTGRFSITNLESEPADKPTPPQSSAPVVTEATAATAKMVPELEPRGPERGTTEPRRALRDGEGRRRADRPGDGTGARNRAAGEREAALEHAGAATLMRLADSARYAGEREREARALYAVRRRFAHTASAAAAAFGLGRIAFDEHAAFGEAAKWFALYLREQPRGALVREARGRLLEARIANGERAAAAGLARDYLARHPHGPHAALARSVLRDGH